MALPVIANVYRCALEWVDADLGMTAINVMHVQKGGSNPAAIGAILDAAANTATANLWQMQSSHSKVVQINITPLDGSSVSFPYPTPVAARWAGTETPGGATPNVSNIIKLLTASRGRSYRGRLYLPWVSESKMAQGQVDAAGRTACTTAWIAFLASLNTAGAPLVVASYKLAVATPVVAIECEQWCATQRRRLKRTAA